MKTTLIALALVATSARAEFFSGNDLLEHLNGNTSQQLVATGYIAGVFDASMGSRICPPQNVQLSQVRDLTRKALEALPAQRHSSADIFIIAAASNAWPCRQQPRGSNI